MEKWRYLLSLGKEGSKGGLRGSEEECRWVSEGRHEEKAFDIGGLSSFIRERDG